MTTNILIVSTLVILWWISIWGLIEIFLKKLIGHSAEAHLVAYVFIMAAIVGIVYMYPGIGESFL